MIAGTKMHVLNPRSFAPQIRFLAALSLLFPLCPLFADKIQLSNEGKLEGSITSINEKSWVLQSKATQSPLQIRKQAIASALFDNSSPSAPYPDRLLLLNGDLLPCEVSVLTAESVTATAFDGKELVFPASHVSGVLFNVATTKTLIDSPQSLKEGKVTMPPQVPDYTAEDASTQTSAEAIVNKSNLKVRNPEDIENDQSKITTQDGWVGNVTSQWSWHGKKGSHSLDIPSYRGYISKKLDFSDHFTLSARYMAAKSRNTSNYTNASSRYNNNTTSLPGQGSGTVFLIGGSHANHLSYYNRLTSKGVFEGEYYVVLLTSGEISVQRVSSKIKENAVVLFQQKITADKNDGYEFELSVSGMQLELYINKKLVGKILDSTPMKISSNCFTIANMEATAAIIKNLHFSSRKKNILGKLDHLPEWQEQQHSYLITNTGEVVPGSLTTYDKQNARFDWLVKDSTGLPLGIPREFVSAVLLTKYKKEKTPSLLQFADLGYLSGDIISLDSSGFKLKHALLDQLSIPRNEIRFIEFLLSKPAEAPAKPEKNN